MRTIHRWLSVCSQSCLHICANGLRTVCFACVYWPLCRQRAKAYPLRKKRIVQKRALLSHPLLERMVEFLYLMLAISISLIRIGLFASIFCIGFSLHISFWQIGPGKSVIHAKIENTGVFIKIWRKNSIYIEMLRIETSIYSMDENMRFNIKISNMQNNLCHDLWKSPLGRYGVTTSMKIYDKFCVKYDFSELSNSKTYRIMRL